MKPYNLTWISKDINKPVKAYGVRYYKQLIPERVGTMNHLIFYFHRWYYAFKWISK